ncbi:MAG: HK97 gp10 family phage protein [Caulobacterales bacterium]|nr:HK97 gp10 family phage protein [Caulobacterales bacterium]
MSGPFKLALADFAAKAKFNADLVIRKTIIDMCNVVIDRSPVGRPELWKRPAPEGYVGGRFRANWVLQIGAASAATTEAVDPTGEATKGQIAAAIPVEAGGKVYYLTNSLPYAWPLEAGHSTQAPAGMVGLTVLEFQTFVDRAASELN